MKLRFRRLADGRLKPIAPEIVQYRIAATGEVVDFRPDGHPYRLVIHDQARYEALWRTGYFHEPATGLADKRRTA